MAHHPMDDDEQQAEDDAIRDPAHHMVRRAAPGRRSTDTLGPFIGALSPTWQAAISLALAFLAGAGALSALSGFGGLPARVTALETVNTGARLDAMEAEAITNRAMWRDVRYLVCRSMEHDAGRTARGCRYLYDDELNPAPTRSAPRADAEPTKDGPIYQERDQ